jgi:cytochrome c-type biogenesis protein CcsB
MDNLPVAPSDIRPLQAVLNSYWLDVHVVVCMVSYGGFLLAAILGCVYLGRMGLARLRRSGGAVDAAGEIARAALAEVEAQVYWLVVISWILLAAGIATGAIWAHHAWGRYWGWDPKEVWSLITWVVYALFLHARVFLGWREWRAALFAVAAFGAVVFTYFGVSFLLPGLHSYAT